MRMKSEEREDEKLENLFLPGKGNLQYKNYYYVQLCGYK